MDAQKRQRLVDWILTIGALKGLAGAWYASQLAARHFGGLFESLGAVLPVPTNALLAVARSGVTTGAFIGLGALLILKEFRVKEAAGRLRFTAVIALIALFYLCLLLLSLILPMMTLMEKVK